jgi:hypothetical protein
MSKRTVREFARQWNRSGNHPAIRFYHLDVSESHDDLPQFVKIWLKSDSRLKPLLVHGGNGEVVWIANGEFRHFFPGAYHSVEQLTAETIAIFGE